MAIYKYGTFTVPASNAAFNLNLGFIPSEFKMQNITRIQAGTSPSGNEGWWNTTMGAQTTPFSLLGTWTSGANVWSVLTTTGIVPYQSPDVDLFLPQQAPYTTNLSTNLTITAISKAANASITATHSFTASDIGVTVVTFHGIVGMTQMNTLSGVIQSVTSTTSFTVNINSSNFSTYTSGGIANVITGAPVSTVYGNQILNTALANLGILGLTIGTGFMGASGVTAGDTFSYEAILQSPVTGP
jgi:hypothetical protein